MGLDRLFSAKDVGQKTAAQALIDTQNWLHTNSRDLLDESDELLHIRYQLIYTMGQQKPLENHPDRWTTIQQVFSLVKHIAVTLKQEFPEEMELNMGSENSFPVIRIVGASASKALVSTIDRMALDGEIPNLGLALLPATARAATFRFLTEVNVDQQEYLVVEDHCSGSDIWKGLLLLRGHILLYVLKDKRWRVDYGLDPSRSLFAVPYRAKDVSSPRAEFGHPDVAILLTCPSYYHGGQSDHQLHQSFQLLYQGDNPALEYEVWIHCGDKILLSLRRLDGVNTQDKGQFKHSIFPALCRNHGFSGTNDNRYLLPTSIEQRDPVQQLSTNAQVLMYLLQPENDYYCCTHGSDDKPCSATDFLETLVHQMPEIRVLLDVGAQMLELQNRELASHWLSLRTDVSAAVFFDEADHLIVLTLDGMTESFISSPFNRQLDKCIVYLDDAHTRGTDLRLPKNIRAVVTLGPKVTKDRLIQGCMRMRKLGNGQSVMFFCATGGR
ncbi:hypothetical protein HETIRDRAFT_423187 [Heterobasidion irregulare TC 32-1]|uniref:ubiquitinyl hydrolase 1 n=1 Tax=Heterobasidion irregulare (strain TC 32-1) TaxID=747525 RepID=W4JRM7_HETIT|nr:uncharacterized protein HETIRDRAFT_423187 [Heterobasidion irregulare TC 32-1]ETW75526.1 hypothetical protein HETIRDRAFT_423187 [Heterobasidion irregulare TC 32-1]